MLCFKFIKSHFCIRPLTNEIRIHNFSAKYIAFCYCHLTNRSRLFYMYGKLRVSLFRSITVMTEFFKNQAVIDGIPRPL